MCGVQAASGAGDGERAKHPEEAQPKPIAIGPPEFGISKLGVTRFDIRDPYHLAVRDSRAC
jgi:hypothetical protein